MASREYNYDSIANTLLEYAKNLIVKNNTRAEENETTDSLKNARQFIMATENKDSYNSYRDWTRDEYLQAGVSEHLIDDIMSNKIEVPEKYKEHLLENRRNFIISSYNEVNNYYRMLAGLPNYGEEDIMTSFGKTITELDNDELYRLQQGELESLKLKYPNAEYLNHLGSRSVDFYSSRTADNYDILNYKHYILEEEQALKFNSLYYECKRFILMTNYSKAFKDMYYYDAFITILILFTAMQKFINERYNYAIRKDFYNIDDIRNVFLSYGLPFYNDIPIKYQRNIVRNLNNLLKYKGTDRVLVDVVKLFGFSNTELYKYYLIKDFKRDGEGQPLINLENNYDSYELKFAQVPFESTDITQALQDDSLYQSYEEITSDDPYWGYGIDETDDIEFEDVIDSDEAFKRELLNLEFNYISTKYLSLNTIYDVTKNMMESCYFFNLIDTMQKNRNISSLTFISKELKSSANEICLFDAITALYWLICKKFNYKDNIIKSSTGIASIYAFKFNQDTNELLERIERNAVADINGTILKYNKTKMHENDIQKMNLPKDSYTRDELLDLYFKNTDYRNFLLDRMERTQDYLEYKALNEIYRYNMLADTTESCYGDYKTYSEYLRYNDSELYNFLEESTYSETGINMTINMVLNAIEGFINSYKFDEVFSSLSSLTGDLVKSYIRRMINIFKAYTVELKKINIYYIFDEKTSNRIRMFSLMLKEVNTELADSLATYTEFFDIKNKITIPEDIRMRDRFLWLPLFNLSSRVGLSDSEDRDLILRSIISELGEKFEEKFGIFLFLGDSINFEIYPVENEKLKFDDNITRNT